MWPGVSWSVGLPCGNISGFNTLYNGLNEAICQGKSYPGQGSEQRKGPQIPVPRNTTGKLRPQREKDSLIMLPTSLDRQDHLLGHSQVVGVSRAKSWVCGLFHFSILKVASSLIKIVLRE